MDNNIINVDSFELLHYLYDHSAMTWEGLREEDFPLALKECGGKDAKGYHIKGKLMNEICQLEGDWAYPDDLNIFAVYPFKGLAIQWGARWMDDIIDNNANRMRFHPFSGEHDA